MPDLMRKGKGGLSRSRAQGRLFEIKGLCLRILVWRAAQ